MDTILRNARIADGPDAPLVDIGIEKGRIAAIQPVLVADGQSIELEGRLATPSFVETHIHLDKSCILDRISSTQGGLEAAIGEVARLKREFTAEDVYHRAKRTLEKCALNGTTHMRTHLEEGIIYVITHGPIFTPRWTGSCARHNTRPGTGFRGS